MQTVANLFTWFAYTVIGYEDIDLHRPRAVEIIAGLVVCE